MSREERLAHWQRGFPPVPVSEVVSHKIRRYWCVGRERPWSLSPISLFSESVSLMVGLVSFGTSAFSLHHCARSFLYLGPVSIDMARHTGTTPAIHRKWTQEDFDAEVVASPYNSVSHTRGLGDSGKRIETVEHDCPQCENERMVRVTFVNPTDHDWVDYYCLNFSCPHFVSDTLSHYRTHIPHFRSPRVTE